MKRRVSKPAPMSGALKETRRLLKVVDDLRRNCPWDKKQTHRSLVRYLIEEAFEAAEALRAGGPEAICEELGDLLLQVALHARIASEKKQFDFEKIARGIADKMIRRHPHVYGDAAAEGSESVRRNWDKLKSKEKPGKFILDGTPRAMPALQVAQRYGEKAAGVGFDWDSHKQVLDKLDEEIRELKQELSRPRKNKKQIELELGDVLFTVANLARHVGVDAESSLRASSDKFYRRLAKVDRSIRAAGKHLADCTMGELEAAWNQAKGKR